MKKDFKNWFQKKEESENKKIIAQFKKREIFWTRVGENVGFEQSGGGQAFTRPVLVFKKFSSRVFWGIPLSTKNKQGKFYYSFEIKDKKQHAILSQIKLFDAKRLEAKLSTMAKEDFIKLEKAFQELMNAF